MNRTIVAPALYNHTYYGLQLLEQEDYIYAVENARVDDLVGLRMEAPLDRVLRYSAGAPLVPELEGLVFMNLSAADQEGFSLTYRSLPAFLFANASLLGEESVAALEVLLDNPRYTNAARLILEEIAREQHDSARYNDSREAAEEGSSWPELMVKPAVFCTADRGLCGATPTVLKRKSGSVPATALYEMLVGMHDPDRMDSLFYNYTRILYAADLDVSLVVQRHYLSLAIGTAYANLTYLVRFVCTPLLPMKQYCAGPDANSDDYDWYALFVNYDGVLGHGEARINGQDYGHADL